MVRTRADGPRPAIDGWGANVEFLDEPVVPTLGGCGAAPAYVLGKLGRSVSLSSNLGEDAFGDLLTGWLRSAGVRLSPPPKRARETAAHVIHVDGARRRSSYFRGHKVRWGDGLPEADPAWFVATGYGAVDGEDLLELTSLCRSLRERGVRVLFDPSPWFAGRVAAEAMRSLWQHVDVLSATEEEATHWMAAASTGTALARACVDLGPEMVALKRGRLGACWSAGGEEGEIPAPRQIEGNSIGAGDTFNARLVHGLCDAEPAGEAVTAAVRLATRVVAAGRGVLGAFDKEEEEA